MPRIHFHKSKRNTAEAWGSDTPPWKARNRGETKEAYIRRLAHMRDYMRRRRAADPDWYKKEHLASRKRFKALYGDVSPQKYFKRERVKEILLSIAGEPYDDGLREMPADAAELRREEGPLHRVLGPTQTNQTPTKKQQVDEHDR